MSEKLRAWWFAKQGLGGMEGTPRQVLARSGWARSVGGANPYLTCFSRASAGRQAVDDSVAQLEIHELPSARGCTYVVPREDFALALTLSSTADGGVGAAKRHLGVTDDELERLEGAVLDALKVGPLDPKGISEAAGAAVRHLGEVGKKRGQITTLPLALGRLQTAGRIRRVPADGRLDQQRYQYTLWEPNPLKSNEMSLDDAYVRLAEKYWRWIGPAKVEEFQWFASLSGKRANAAIADLPLEAIGDDFLILADERDDFERFRPSTEPQFALVSAIDAILLLRRDVGSLLTDEDRSQPMLGDRGLRATGDLKDLDHHAIFDRGRLIGFWEYDPDAQEVVWKNFNRAEAGLAEAVEQMETFAREDLGDVRSFSLDSPASRKPKIEFLRAG